MGTFGNMIFVSGVEAFNEAAQTQRKSSHKSDKPVSEPCEDRAKEDKCAPEIKTTERHRQ